MMQADIIQFSLIRNLVYMLVLIPMWECVWGEQS